MEEPDAGGPDSPVATMVLPSPNHGPRRDGRRPDMLLLHYTEMASADLAAKRLRDPATELSAHYLVFEDGRIAQLVAEARRAWHAGAGAWAGYRDINSCSIGVEIAHPGHAGGLPPYPVIQIEAVIRLCRDVARRWTIPPRRILGHSDVAPARKQDPGETFPWSELHAAGIGHWVAPRPIREGAGLTRDDLGARVSALQAALARYGYDLVPTGVYDEATALVVAAFQRHFRPERVDGIADRSTLGTLDDLLDALRDDGRQRPH